MDGRLPVPPSGEDFNTDSGALPGIGFNRMRTQPASGAISSARFSESGDLWPRGPCGSVHTGDLKSLVMPARAEPTPVPERRRSLIVLISPLEIACSRFRTSKSRAAGRCFLSRCPCPFSAPATAEPLPAAQGFRKPGTQPPCPLPQRVTLSFFSCLQRSFGLLQVFLPGVPNRGSSFLPFLPGFVERRMLCFPGVFHFFGGSLVLRHSCAPLFYGFVQGELPQTKAVRALALKRIPYPPGPAL